MAFYSKHIFVCCNKKAPGNQCCANTGGEPFFEHLKTKLLELDLHGPGKIRVSKTGCLGRCASGPCIVIYPENVWYTYASFEDIDKIIVNYLVAGRPVESLLMDK